MEQVSKEVVERHLAQAYWPWPLALAYSLPVDVRDDAVAAVAEVFEHYPGSGIAQFTGACAVGRAYEVATGRAFKGHPEEGTGTDGLPFTVKSGAAVYSDELAELELPLLGSLQAGQLKAWGRRSAGDALEEIPAAHWVGSEVDGDETCDLVRKGWRGSDLLSQALDEVARQVCFYDIHLFGAAVRQFVQAHDAAAQDADMPLLDTYLSKAGPLRGGGVLVALCSRGVDSFA